MLSNPSYGSSRGTPLMLQLLIIYYGPGLILGQQLVGWQTPVGSLPRWLPSSSTTPAIFPKYIAAVSKASPRGQVEAGLVLGMTKSQIFFPGDTAASHKTHRPAPWANEIITLVKDTSLARVIAVYEVIWNGQAFIKSSGIIWPLFLYRRLLPAFQWYTDAAAWATGKEARLFQGLREDENVLY